METLWGKASEPVAVNRRPERSCGKATVQRGFGFDSKYNRNPLEALT